MTASHQQHVQPFDSSSAFWFLNRAMSFSNGPSYNLTDSGHSELNGQLDTEGSFMASTFQSSPFLKLLFAAMAQLFIFVFLPLCSFCEEVSSTLLCSKGKDQWPQKGGADCFSAAVTFFLIAWLVPKKQPCNPISFTVKVVSGTDDLKIILLMWLCPARPHHPSFL
ncbi:hypothetical protein Anapl_01506 [Anas platyrhynchos]|uniref:Uncharacterized protein n=1 Tax=Anas platyrhynchos TaxID=8839 RepID=R0KD49_ANAPL|nr:hypothetical protein Anapl_01506 [Anas platyrhynchos]